MATVNVVKGSADEAILRAQYGDAVKFNYTNANQFAGADRTATNALYQGVLGKPINNAGDLNNYGGIKLQAGGSLSDSQIQANQMADNQAKYQQQLTDFASQTAQATADAKRLALDQAWGSNQQALNSQNATVSNNFNSAKNNLTALQASRLPEYQAQKNATSQEAAAQLRRTEALNALTGKFNSGYNRSQVNDVGIARQGSLDAIQGSENQFKTDVGNQLSDVDAQRVAALNDIAEKLTLGKQQYNQGTLSLTNQLESEKATGALKAMLDAQEWGDTQSQLGIDNSLRQAQFDQSANLAELQQQFQQKEFDAQQQAQLWEQQFKQQGYTADEAYRQAALAASGSSYKPTATEIKNNYTSEAYSDIQKALDGGASPEEVKQSLLSRSSDYAQMGIPVSSLISQVDAIVKSWGMYDEDTPKSNPIIANKNASAAWNSLNNMWNR